MKIIYGGLDNPCLDPKVLIRELSLNLISDCDNKGVNVKDVAIHFNVDDLLELLNHPLCYNLGRVGFEGLLGFNYKILKDEGKGIVTAWGNGLMLDTVWFLHDR
ncbi:hypothetical protein VPIG_00110 [Vibrio phage PWH3a-P1]|uniref:hypothetical protein n=1 Tax=Vibrio phage PWH3a-P1 TaxID=754058 RepID=UPI0002C13819|nr:hypothetical protein VPIG_00110 [Vibrio phage PWH3a-P1]AGH31967.1 hypothetical protein VPIG_00110 [Vibrio phage PWH3a-P1]